MDSSEQQGKVSAREAAQMVDDGCRGAMGPPFLVTYRGSIPEHHGDAWHVGDCHCVWCFGAAPADRHSLLVTLAGQVLHHVRDVSWTPQVEDLPCLHPDPTSATSCPACGTHH